MAIRALAAIGALAAVIGAAAGAPPSSGGAIAAGANLWVDINGGSCSRASQRTDYSDQRACGSIASAWTACRAGDVVIVRAGAYGPQTVVGTKPAPGCRVVGMDGTTIGALVTGGRFFTLENVTIDVGESKRVGWRAAASNVTLRRVSFRGPFVHVAIAGVSDVRWLGGEFGDRGRIGGARVCGEDAEPVEISDSARVTIDGVRFNPQNADPTPSSCSANGFHLEMIRIDGGTSFFTLRNSTFVSGDRSGTASVFITEPGGYADPHDLVFENNFFGTNDSVGAFNVHGNVSTCRNFTFAYNTFVAPTGAFQCTTAENVRWIGNLGANGPTTPCFGAFTRNVWQDTHRGSCGSDKWVYGERGRTDRLGLAGADGFHLEPGSPAIDAGEAAGYCTSDLRARDNDGDRRHVGTRCDAGADERRDRAAVAASIAGTRFTASRSHVAVTLVARETVTGTIALLSGTRTISTARVALRQGRRTVRLAASFERASEIRATLVDVAGNRRVLKVPIRAVSRP